MSISDMSDRDCASIIFVFFSLPVPPLSPLRHSSSQEVKHVEPLDPGKAKQPSVAFCCLAKFVLIKLDRRQLRLVLQHKKPLVRAVGILYLRIAANVKEIYEWLDPFLGDDTQFCPMVDSKRSISFGEFIMGCFADLKYFPNCVLRRIPQNLLNDMERKTVEREILRERAEVHRHLLQAGVQCQCKYVDGKAYPIVIDEALQNRNFLVTYSEYAEQAEVPITDLVFDPATLRGAKGSRDHDREEHRRDRDRRDRSRSPDRRDRSRSPDRRDRRSGRDRDDDRERRRRSRTPEKKDRSERPQLSLQEEITQRIARKRKTNMDKHVASDGNYAKLPTGYKKALGETVETVNRPRFEPRR